MHKKRNVDWTRYNLFLFAGIISLPFISLYVAPLIHEYAHLSVLGFLGCPAYADISYDVGINAEVYTSCNLDSLPLAALYISGVLSTLIMGAILLAIDWQLTKKNHLELSVYLSYIALGFIYSTSEYFFKTEGDIIYALESLGIPYTIPALRVAGASLLFACVAYFMKNLRLTTKKEKAML